MHEFEIENLLVVSNSGVVSVPLDWTYALVQVGLVPKVQNANWALDCCDYYTHGYAAHAVPYSIEVGSVLVGIDHDFDAFLEFEFVPVNRCLAKAVIQVTSSGLNCLHR